MFTTSTGSHKGDPYKRILTRIAIEEALSFEPLIPNSLTIAAMKQARTGHLRAFDTIDALVTELNEDM